jgi:two-component system cell cycle response regulator
MVRRFAYAFAGCLLSAGAPAGLLGVKLVRTRPRPESMPLRAAARELSRDPAEYLYLAASTAVAFAAFGYVLGCQADRLARLSETDALTGLINARGLFERLHAELARLRRYREPLSLVLVDLDGLKGINDRYGHSAGDAAIRGLADAIRSELRQPDIGARWGGDEFAVLAPSTSQVAAAALGERIRVLVSTRRALLPLTASVGVATTDPKADPEFVDSSSLMRAADAALYEAKRRGRNRVVSASPTITLLPDSESARRHGATSLMPPVRYTS